MEILLQKSAHYEYFLRQLKFIAYDDFSVCSLNAKSFYHWEGQFD